MNTSVRKLSAYTIASNCSDLSDINAGLEEMAAHFKACEKAGKTPTSTAYIRYSNLAMKRDELKCKMTTKVREEYIEISEEKFAEIYTNQEFLKHVACPHICCYQSGKFSHYGTTTYPQRYKVSEEQKTIAREHRDKLRGEKIAHITNTNKLVFVAMGMSYEPKYYDDVCNYRIRSEIIAPDGHEYFIELAKWAESGEKIAVDFSIDRTLEKQMKLEEQRLFAIINQKGYFDINHPQMNEYREALNQPYYHNTKLGTKETINMKYTLKNILKIVNEAYGCHFKEIEIDNHLLTTDDYSSVSPKN